MSSTFNKIAGLPGEKYWR